MKGYLYNNINLKKFLYNTENTVKKLYITVNFRSFFVNFPKKNENRSMMTKERKSKYLKGKGGGKRKVMSVWWGPSQKQKKRISLKPKKSKKNEAEERIWPRRR